MSVIDRVGAAVQKSSSGPAQYVSTDPAVYDSETRRTYQLIERVGSKTPHTASCAGNHPQLIEQLNKSKRLAHERGQLREKSKRSAADDARIEQLSAEIKALTSVSVERADHTARMLAVYAERGVE